MFIRLAGVVYDVFQRRPVAVLISALPLVLSKALDLAERT